MQPDCKKNSRRRNALRESVEKLFSRGDARGEADGPTPANAKLAGGMNGSNGTAVQNVLSQPHCKEAMKGTQYQDHCWCHASHSQRPEDHEGDCCHDPVASDE